MLSTCPKLPHETLPRQIQILWNQIDIGCFYLLNATDRQQYLQLLSLAKSPPRQLFFVSVLFDELLVLQLDIKQNSSINLLQDFYRKHPNYLQTIKAKFVCYPPQFLLDWEFNFCQKLSTTEN